MKLKYILLSFVLLACSMAVVAQNVVKGIVTDATDGEPLVGVTVVLDGTTTGTSTDLDGKFTMQVKSKQGILNLSYIGYESVKLPFVAGGDEYKVLLNPEASELDEVVVVGYGVQKKSHLTGAIAKFDADKLGDIPVSNIDQALQGKIAGVNINNVDQEAGAATQIRIRGMSSISASSEPLVVLDGFPIADGLQFINMKDVESIEVLKDAASAAIYGSRGANGVIMITTKAGSASKPKYTASAFMGVKTAYKLYDMMNSVEYLEMLYNDAKLRELSASGSEGSDEFSKYNLATAGEKAAYVFEKDVMGGGVDWQQEALRDMATIKNFQFNVSGGSKTLKYLVSSNYSTDQGLMYHSQFDKFNFRARVDANLSPTLTVGANLSPTYTSKETPASNFTDFYRWYSFSPVYHTQATADFINAKDPTRNIKVGDWAQVLDFASLPYEGVMPDGTYWNSLVDGISDADRYPSPSNSANNSPRSVMETQYKNQYGYRLQGSTYLMWQPLQGLIFKTNNSLYYNYTQTEGYINRNSVAKGNSNQASYANSLMTDLLSENTGNYMFSKGKNEINLLAGFTVQQTDMATAGLFGADFPTDYIHTLNGAGLLMTDGSFTRKDREVLISYLGRATWSYDNRYLASVSFRADGSSKFKDKKWGLFPSISAGWIVSNESFMRPTSSWLKTLKLRASYGVTGNNKITSYSYTDLLNSANNPFGLGSNQSTAGLAPTNSAFGNPRITWEQTDEYNAGVDLGFFNNRITMAVDMYYAVTRSLLFKQAAMAFSGHNEYWNNIGRVRNKGLEIELSSINMSTKDFVWKTTLNLSMNRNRLLELGGEPYQFSYGERNEVYAAIVGDPAIQFFGYKTDGVWTSQEQIDKSGLAGKGTVPIELGGLRVVDTNGDGMLTPDDRTVIGNPFADFTWGVTNSFTWKAFDFSFLFQGAQGGQLINGDIYYNESKKYNRAYNSNRWITSAYPGDSKTPYMANGVDMMLTDYVVEDASYISLRDVSLGYTLPKSVTQKIKISSLRMYASMQNLLFLMGDGYRGLNPEGRTTSGVYASPLIDGYQRGAFPVNRTLTFGLDVTF